jgi:hypothetical protein
MAFEQPIPSKVFQPVEVTFMVETLRDVKRAFVLMNKEIFEFLEKPQQVIVYTDLEKKLFQIKVVNAENSAAKKVFQRKKNYWAFSFSGELERNCLRTIGFRPNKKVVTKILYDHKESKAGKSIIIKVG